MSRFALLLTAAAIATPSMFAAEADLVARLQASDRVLLVMDGMPSEVPIDYGGVYLMPYYSTVVQPGVGIGPTIVIDAIGNAIANAMVTSSIESHRAEKVAKEMAPVMAAFGPAAQIAKVRGSIIAEITAILGHEPWKVQNSSATNDAEGLKTLYGKRDGFVIRMRFEPAITEDKREVRVLVTTRLYEVKGGRSKQIQQLAVSAYSSPLTVGPEPLVYDALVSDSAARFSAMFDEAARAGVRAGLIPLPEELDKPSKDETYILNAKAALTVKGRVLSMEPRRLVVDDGQGEKATSIAVDRYL